MNKVTESVYLSMLEQKKFDNVETEKAFYNAYDYIVDMAECDDNEEEKSRIFNLLSNIENQTRKAAFQVGMHTAFQLLERNLT